jgi:hypothetical protein
MGRHAHVLSAGSTAPALEPFARFLALRPPRGYRTSFVPVLRARFVTTAALTALTFASLPARAGNSDTFFLGNEAALMAGAVTASTRGATALWYNPAGLAINGASSVDASLNAYLLRFGGTPDLVTDAAKGGTQQKLTTLDISPVPTVLSYTRKLGNWQIGAGLFVPNRSSTLPRTKVSVAGGNGQTLSLAQDGNSRFSEYYAGIGVGRSLAPNFRVGGALFVYYSSRVDTNMVYVGSGESDTSATQGALLHDTYDETRVGYQFVWGFQWAFAHRFQFGTTFRSPVFQAYQIIQQVTATALGAEAVPHRQSLEFGETVGLKDALLKPMRAHFGLSYEPPKWRIAIEGNVQAPYDNPGNRDGTSRAVGNVRLGVRHDFSENLSLGGGVFTDFSPYDPLTSPKSASIDYYGVSLGVRMANLYTARKAGEAKDGSLVMSSTFGISYAYGTGTLGNIELASAATGAVAATRLDAVTAHEFTFYLGSTLEM